MNIPASFANLYVEVCKISDTDIPSGNGGINKEGYTYGELRHQPIIPELMAQITHPKIRQMAEECNSRNRKEGFAMYKVDGEYCFWELRVGPVVKTPSKEELLKIFPERPVTASAIRAVTYEILRKEIALQCNMSLKEAAEAIGNQLDCAPHEDISGHIFMVPNWAHKWFRHRRYVAKILNGKE